MEPKAMVLMRLPSGQQWRKRPVDTVGGEAKAGETYGESNTEIYNTIRKIPAQAGIKTVGRNIDNLRYADDTTLLAESEEELKSLLMKVKEESEKVALKLNIEKTKIMASGPITSQQIDGEQWKQWLTFFFWAPKSLQMMTAAMKLKDTCSMEGKL